MRRDLDTDRLAFDHPMRGIGHLNNTLWDLGSTPTTITVSPLASTKLIGFEGYDRAGPHGSRRAALPRPNHEGLRFSPRKKPSS
jgi:hypothetical protein